jgi:hypothetical protein
VVFIVFGVLLFIWFRRRHQRQPNVAATTVTTTVPFSANDEVKNLLEMQEMSGWKINAQDLLIETEIGRGSYGVVYRGYWRGGAAAIKTFDKDQIGRWTRGEVDTLLREISLMKGLRPHGKNKRESKKRKRKRRN